MTSYIEPVLSSAGDLDFQLIIPEGAKEQWSELLNETLGLSEIANTILSFVPGSYFNISLRNYFLICKMFRTKLLMEKNMIQSNQKCYIFPTCLFSLYKRKIIHCQSEWDMTFITSNYLFIPDQEECEIILSGSLGQWSTKFKNLIEKFPTVHFQNTSTKFKDLIELINPSTSLVKHIKITDMELVEMENFNHPYIRKTKISPRLKKLSFLSDRHDTTSAFDHFNLKISNIHELVFKEFPNKGIKKIILQLDSKLKSLSIVNLSRNYNRSTLYNLQKLQTNVYPDLHLNVRVFDLKSRKYRNMEIDYNVRTLILRECDYEKNGLGNFIQDVVADFPNCEELILSESYIKLLTEEDLKEISFDTLLKTITIKYSNNCRNTLVCCILKFALQTMFKSKVVIKCEKTEINSLEEFETYSINNCPIRDELFRKIQKAEAKLKINESTGCVFMEMMRTFTLSMIRSKYESSKNFNEEMYLVHNNLEILEGLQQNKKHILELFKNSITIYSDINGESDELYLKSVEQLNKTKLALENNARDFPKEFNILEGFLNEIAKTVEKYYPTLKVLFPDQYVSDLFVEDYENRLMKDDDELVEDDDDEILQGHSEEDDSTMQDEE